MKLRTIPASVAVAAAVAALGFTGCSASSAPIKAGQTTPQAALPSETGKPSGSATGKPTAGQGATSAAPTAVLANLCGSQQLFVPDVTLTDCTWTGGMATPAGGQHFLEGKSAAFGDTVTSTLTKAGYAPQVQNAGAQTVYVGKGWFIHVLAIDTTVTIQFAPVDPNAEGSSATAAAPKPSTAPSTGNASTPGDTSSTGPDAELDSDGLPYPVPSSLVNLTHVPEYWMLPGKGKIQNLQDSDPGASYDLANYTTDQLINFYRMRINKNNFKKVSDTVDGGVVTLVFDSLSSHQPYRTTITSTATGVHVDHRTL